MNIYDAYPESVIVDGEEMRVNFGYDRILKVIDVQSMEDLTPADKIDLQSRLLFDDPPETIEKQAKAITAVFALFPKAEENSGERYIDFHQDAALIRSGFMRIGIDLTKNRIHFFQFLELLGDLPTDSALMRVIDIRRRPVPKMTEANKEYVHELMKAKARCAIKMSDEERREQFTRKLKQTSILRG
jgi:hypothetical protein